MMRTAAGKTGVLPVVPRHLQCSPTGYISVPVTLSGGLPGTGMPAERVYGVRGGKESRRLTLIKRIPG